MNSPSARSPLKFLRFTASPSRVSSSLQPLSGAGEQGSTGTHHTQNKAHLAKTDFWWVAVLVVVICAGNARAQRQQRRDAIERLPPHSWVDFRSRSSSGSGSLFFRSALHPENGTKKGAAGVWRAGSSSVAKSTEIISLLFVCVFGLKPLRWRGLHCATVVS